MSDYVLVEYGDLEGGGFVPYVAEGRPEPPAPFTAAATRLVQNNVPQPPEPDDDGHRHPLWSLRVVDVEAERHWCFAVQGRGGAFGQAGMCQFLFAPVTAHPGDLWHDAVGLVRPDGRLAHPGAGPGTGHWRRPREADRVRAGLAGLFAGEAKVVLDGEPLDVAATVGALLSVVPAAVARERVWSTCLVRRPTQDNRPIVTGHWPDALPGGNEGLRSWLKRPAERGAPVAHARAEQVVDWLAHRGALGERLPDHLAELPDLDALTAAVVRTELDFELPDVGGMLALHDQRLLLGRGLELLGEWVAHNPLQAVRHLVDPLPAAHEHAVFDALLDEHVQAAPGANPALFPPAASVVPGWAEKLVPLLKGRFTHGQLVDFVRDYLIAPGRPLHGADAYLAHEGWLTSLGVPPGDPSLGIYEVPTRLIAEELGRTGQLSATGRRFLLGAVDPVGEAKRVVDQHATAPPAVVAELIGLFDDRARIAAVLDHALDRGLPGGGHRWAEEWLAEVHALADRSRKPAVLSAALGSFRREGLPPPPPLLVLGLRAAANRNDPSSEAYWVLTQAAAALEEAPGRRSARSAPSWSDGSRAAPAPAVRAAWSSTPAGAAPAPTAAAVGEKPRKSRGFFRRKKQEGGALAVKSSVDGRSPGPGHPAHAQGQHQGAQSAVGQHQGVVGSHQPAAPATSWPSTAPSTAASHSAVSHSAASHQAAPPSAARDDDRFAKPAERSAGTSTAGGPGADGKRPWRSPGARPVRRAVLPGLSAHWPLIGRLVGVLLVIALLVGLFLVVDYMMHR